MEFYFAPLEGITNRTYRKIYDRYFSGVSEYYIPFLNPMSDHTLTNKENKEIDPTNNQVKVKVIPQIISKDADATIWLISHLKELGYQEVNLNFGCPSGTVTAKGRGAGMLKDLNKMDDYLNKVFSSSVLPISIKIRLGMEDEKEFDAILKILNKYKIKKLIIHPRTAKDKYVGPLHLNVMDGLDKKTSFDIVYNGEIRSKEDIAYIEKRFPYIKGIMLGRGLVSIPDLLEEENHDENYKRERIRNFFLNLKDEFLSAYGWNITSYFMKEIWIQLVSYFIIPSSLKKSLFKAKKEEEFLKYADIIIATCPLNEHPDNGFIHE